MNKIINKIVALIVILGIILAQTTVFANNVGLDPNNYIEMPMSIKTNRAETITIHNLQNYRMAYQIVETPSENYKKYVAFIDESNARKEQLTNEKNQLKAVVEAAQAEAEAKYKIYSELNSNIHATSEQREQAKLAFEAAKDVADKALQPYQAKLAEMEAYDRTSEETLKSFIPSYGTFTIPSNNNGKERIVTVWVRVVDENSNTYYEATMYPFNLGKGGTEAQTKRYTLEIDQGREYDLVMENYNPAEFVWTIENPEIIEVANGKIKGNKAGTTNLNGISNDGRTKVAVVVKVREVAQPAQPEQPTQPENNNSGNVNNNTNTKNKNNNTNQENPTNNNAENTNKENNNTQPTQPTNNNTENTNNTTPANNNVENTNNRNQSNKPVENTNNTNNNANRPSENTNNNQNTAESTNNHQNTANANNNNTNTKPTTPNAVNNNTEVPTNTNNFPNNTTNNATNNTKNTNTNNNSNKAVLKEESKTRNTGSINSGLEKDAPKRLPQTGDIPMSAVITIITAGVIAIGMFIKIYKLRKNN